MEVAGGRRQSLHGTAGSRAQSNYKIDQLAGNGGEDDKWPQVEDKSATTAGEPAAEEPIAAVKKPRAKRPKLTLDLLKEPTGLPELFHSFPKLFRSQFRGPGHELGDLRRLLEMYQRWQHRLMPTMTFDSFVSAAEHLSGTHSVRAELHEMRMGLLKIAEDVLQPAPPAAHESLPASAAAALVPSGSQEEDDLGVDDEEFLELLHQPVSPRVEAVEEEEEDLALPEEDERALMGEDGRGEGPAARSGALGEEEMADEDLDIFDALNDENLA